MDKHNLSTSNFKQTRSFVLKLLFMFAVIVLFGIHIMPQYSGGYNASLIDKVARLKSIDEPKIVLIGNSNLAFGIDSELIEEEFGMPVVNMGMHGSLGNSFHEEMAKLNVHEGDIYVICHTSFADDDTIGDEVLAWTYLENHVELWELLRVKDIWPMVKAYPTYFKKCLNLYIEGTGNEVPEGCYSRVAFNQWGDIETERTESEYTFDRDVVPPGVNDTTVERMNELNDWLQERSASMVVAAYPIGKGELTADEEMFVAFQERLEEELDCPVISDYTTYFFDYSMFYNTDLHLTDEGTQKRTQQLIEDLHQWMEQGNNQR